MLVLWPIFVLLSFFGWGCVVRKLFWRDQSEWGLCAVWGLAVTQILISILSALSFGAFGGLLVVWVAAGDLVAIWELGKKVPALGRMKFAPKMFWLTAIFFFCAALHFANSYGDTNLDRVDDFQAYVPHAKMLLQTGAMNDPFSMRRVATYGGQSAMHALLLIAVPDFHLEIFESGICFLLLVLLLFSVAPQEKRARAIWIFFLIGLCWYSFPIHNISPLISGALVYAALAVCAKKNPAPTAWREIFALALVLASFSSLRPNFLLGGFLFLALTLYFNRARSREAIGPQDFRVFAVVAALLLPSAWSLFRASGTWVYPPFAGNLNLHYGTFDFPKTGSILANFAAQLWDTNAPWLFPMAYLAYKSRKETYLFSALVVGFFLAITVSLSFAKAEPHEISRYVHPFIFVAIVFFFRDFTDDFLAAIKTPLAKYDLRMALTVLLFAWSFNYGAKILALLHVIPRNLSLLAIRASDGLPADPFKSLRDDYAQLQMKIPEGATLLAAASHPFLFDYGRNRIYQIDIPGHASPPPGLPDMTETENVRTYLKTQKIDFFVFSSPNLADGFYTLHEWKKHEREAPKSFYKDWLPHFTGLFDFEQKLLRGSPPAAMGTEIYAFKL